MAGRDRQTRRSAALPPRRAFFLTVVTGICASFLLASGRWNYPHLHTGLDTASFVVLGVLAWLLWDMSVRLRRHFPRRLAISFGVASLLEFVHVMSTVEWHGALAFIAASSNTLRPVTWGPASYALPIGIAGSIWLIDRRGRQTRFFGLGLTLVCLAVLVLLWNLPTYTRPVLAGITRPALIPVPLLWATVTLLCLKLLRRERTFPSLALMSGVFCLGHLAMLWSTSPHDTAAMVAHVGKVGAGMILLLSLMQMATVDMLERQRSQRELAKLNDELEDRVWLRTSEIQDANRALEGEIEVRRSAELALERSRSQILTLIEQAPISIAMFDREMNYLASSRRWNEDYAGGAEVTGKNHYELIPDIPERWKAVHRRALAGEIVREDEDVWVTADGNRQWLRWAVHPWTEEDGSVGGLIISTENLTVGKRAQHELHRFVSLSPVVIYSLDPKDLNIVWTSENAEGLVGWGAEELRRPDWWAAHIHPDDLERVRAAHPLPYEIPHQILEFRLRRKDGSYTWIRDEKRLLAVDGVGEEIIGSWSDIAERVILEDQLRQSQKMEAIGRLAGGIAHDFNNLLTVILGYTDLSQQVAAQGAGDGELPDFLGQIKDAGTRAKVLVAQLLAFSRKQVLRPRVVDLNELVANTDKLLRRVIGEDVELRTVGGADLGHVLVDEVQLQQILVNLAVNSRDAMPSGGKLTIETANVELDNHYRRMHAEVIPGRYVMLAVSDTGSGMDPETRAQVFEPFFTTKGVGKGTGLGLSTVFGIVKQSGGHIFAYSEPGQGAVFKVYFPRVDAPVETKGELADATSTLRGTETLLLVEDEDVVRKLARTVLEGQGYRVHEAASGREALDKVEELESSGACIQLLLTDVVMPGMSGPELVRELLCGRPSLRVLFMSGYADNAVVDHGLLDEDAHFLAKPFTADALARKVRELLDAPAVSQDDEASLVAGAHS